MVGHYAEHVRRSSWDVQFLDDALGKEFLDLTMPGNGLADPGLRVLIPIVTTAVTDEDATGLLNLTDQIAALHAT